MKKLLLLTVLTGMGMITTELDAASFTSTGSMLTTREDHTIAMIGVPTQDNVFPINHGLHIYKF